MAPYSIPRARHALIARQLPHPSCLAVHHGPVSSPISSPCAVLEHSLAGVMYVLCSMHEVVRQSTAHAHPHVDLHGGGVEVWLAYLSAEDERGTESRSWQEGSGLLGLLVSNELACILCISGYVGVDADPTNERPEAQFHQ